MGNRTQLLGPGGTVTPRRSIPAVFVQPTRPRCGATDGGLVVQQGLVTLKKGRRAQRRMRPGRSHRSGVASSQRCPSGEPIDQHVKEQPDLGAQLPPIGERRDDLHFETFHPSRAVLFRDDHAASVARRIRRGATRPATSSAISWRMATPIRPERCTARSSWSARSSAPGARSWLRRQLRADRGRVAGRCVGGRDSRQGGCSRCDGALNQGMQQRQGGRHDPEDRHRARRSHRHSRPRS